MSLKAGRRRLIVNADDFGRSSAVNQAVLQAHTRGILTSASLMVTEPGFGQAVAIAKEHPSLGVGLHLVLLCGHSALGAARIPGLVNARGEFMDAPFRAGMRYWLLPELRAQLRSEIHEQFRLFRLTGLPLDHVNGHLHLHLHPVVLSILLQDAKQLGIARIRLTSDPLRLNLRLARGAHFYRLSHFAIFGALSLRAGRRIRASGIRHADRVFGLLQNARVGEAFVSRLIEDLPPGDSELYSHPDVEDCRHEFEALISAPIRTRIGRLGIELIRYQDL